MGGNTFFVLESGKTAADAFRSARSSAAYEYGHGGYTGSIAEKHDFVMISDTPREVVLRLRDRIRAEKNKEEKLFLKSTIRSIRGRRAEKMQSVANALIQLHDRRVDDKWGPAGCIQLKKKLFLFFGWASS